MAYTSDDEKEIFLKILYAGASGSGKTTNLQSLYKQSAQGLKSRRFDLFQVTEKSPLFDFLPLSYSHTSNQRVRLHLYTLPSQNLWPSLLSTLITGIDGCILIFDSRQHHYPANERELDRLEGLFFENDLKDKDQIPIVCQCNHRDSEFALPMSSIENGLKDWSIQKFVEGVAVQDIGVVETLEKLVLKVLDHDHTYKRLDAFSATEINR